MYILENITMREFKMYLKETKTIVFPFGTVEEHGSHLPLNTDSFIIQEALKSAAKEEIFSCSDTFIWCLYDHERSSRDDKHIAGNPQALCA